MRKNLTKSLIINENIKAYSITKIVIFNGSGLRTLPIPTVDIMVATSISSNNAVNNVLLGIELQKCFLSLTTNNENTAKKNRISKENVCIDKFSVVRLKNLNPINNRISP